MIFLSVIILLFILYSILIIYYWRNWLLIPDYTGAINANTNISVIIPARNEEKNISKLLKALKEQTYSTDLFEIIVVDDNSTDRTAAITQQFVSVKLIQLTEEGLNSHKKKAIDTGIALAANELIVTTDADCIPSKEWINLIAMFYEEKRAALIVAPVIFENDNSVLEIFQALDFLVLQGITAASVYKNIHSMCNGANLAYEKKIFYEVGGFSGIDNIASGDDMLLMHKIWKKYPDRIKYLKSKKAIVITQPMKTWKEFFNQRIRWASKAKQYDDKRIFFVLLLVYLFNLSFLILLIAAFWHPVYWLWLVGLWIAKTMIELPFVNSVAGFFGKRSLMKYFFFFQPIHIFYTIAAGLFGQFGKYEWKGRRVR